MELNRGSHMVLLSVTAVIVNKMQSFHSEHSGWERTRGTRGCGGSVWRVFLSRKESGTFSSSWVLRY